MSALDQAFVRAYEQPAVATEGPAHEPSPVVSMATAVRTPSSGVEGIAPPAPTQPEASAAPTAAKSRPARRKSSRAPKNDAHRRTRGGHERQAPPTRASFEPSRDKPASSRPERSSGGSKSKAGGEFRPLLEVDAFLWPRNVGKLSAPDQTSMDQLTANLLKRVRRGQKAVGWQACRHGDGCSTLLLAAARRLAEQGLKVVLVDADFRHPALARRLGLTPNSGWEEVAAGRLAPEEIVVESLQDRVSLAPWCASPEADTVDEAKSSKTPDALLEMLRHAYDMVLVDLGHGDPDGGHQELLDAVRSRLDAVLVVHKVDEVPQVELRRVCRTLLRSGKAKLAVVENFV